MRDRIFKWHQRNPSSPATATLLNTIDSCLLGPPSAITTTTTAAPAQTTYQLTSNDHIAVLEAELFNLKTRKQGADQGPRTQAQKARGVTMEEEEEDKADVAATHAQLRTSRIEEVNEQRAPQSQSKGGHLGIRNSESPANSRSHVTPQPNKCKEATNSGGASKRRDETTKYYQ